MARKRVMWADGRSFDTVPIKHQRDYEAGTAEVSLARSHKAVHKGARASRPGRPLIVAKPRRDHSHKYIRQSGGYVTSGWRSY